MKHILPGVRKLSLAGSSLLLVFFLLFNQGCQRIQDELRNLKELHAKKLPGNFQQVNLVANNKEYMALRIDSFLINPWGLAFSTTGTPWIASQGSGLSQVYDKEGVQVRNSVGIPSPAGPTGGNPTGVVFNGSNTDFILSNGQAGRFLFVGVDGVISGWNGAAGNNALLIKNNVATSAYTGLAIATIGTESFLYAANFRTGKVDVFDRTFNLVTNKPFSDPYLPANYSPFNVQTIGDKVYVTYAKVGPDGRDEKAVGNGVVNIFNTSGILLKRFASKGLLNSPWGVAQAPASFFDNSNTVGPAILIGNFGDGRINAYSLEGVFLGQVQMNNMPLEIEGLWALTFPPATATTIDPNRLYFTAGPDEETHGIFGYLIKK